MSLAHPLNNPRTARADIKRSKPVADTKQTFTVPPAPSAVEDGEAMGEEKVLEGSRAPGGSRQLGVGAPGPSVADDGDAMGEEKVLKGSGAPGGSIQLDAKDAGPSGRDRPGEGSASARVKGSGLGGLRPVAADLGDEVRDRPGGGSASARVKGSGLGGLRPVPADLGDEGRDRPGGGAASARVKGSGLGGPKPVAADPDEKDSDKDDYSDSSDSSSDHAKKKDKKDKKRIKKQKKPPSKSRLSLSRLSARVYQQQDAKRQKRNFRKKKDSSPDSDLPLSPKASKKEKKKAKKAKKAKKSYRSPSSSLSPLPYSGHKAPLMPGAPPDPDPLRPLGAASSAARGVQSGEVVSTARPGAGGVGMGAGGVAGAEAPAAHQKAEEGGVAALGVGTEAGAGPQQGDIGEVVVGALTTGVDLLRGAAVSKGDIGEVAVGALTIGRYRRGGSRSPYNRCRSPEGGGFQRQVDTRTKEEVAASLALAAELARLSSLQNNSTMPNQANQQLTRHARRVYVGNLPHGLSEASLSTFFNGIMNSYGGAIGPNQVLSIFMNADKHYAFVELKGMTEASNAMAFDGITLGGNTLRVRRPHDYNPQAAQLLGAPLEPSPVVIAAVSNALMKDPLEPRKIYVGGLPLSINEQQVRDMLSAFGPLRYCNVVVGGDSERGDASCALCDYVDNAHAELAVVGLAAINIAGKPLKACWADTTVASAPLPKPVAALPTPTSATQAAGPGRATQALAAGAPPQGTGAERAVASASTSCIVRLANMATVSASTSCIVRLANMVERDELVDDEEYGDVLEDCTTEVSKYGKLKQVLIPRPVPGDGEDPPGVGLVFLCFEEAAAAEKARTALHGRPFVGELALQASSFSQADFDEGKLS
eukprot:gene16554-22783_t